LEAEFFLVFDAVEDGLAFLVAPLRLGAYVFEVIVVPALPLIEAE
jgi:hypothetical protein